MLEFDWDENKRFINERKHGIDFYFASRAFWGYTLQKKVWKNGEERKIAIGRMGDDVIFIVFVERDNVIRLISARPASKNERKLYWQNYPRDSKGSLGN